MRRAAREAAVFLFYLALAIAMTWPLTRELSTAVSDLGDPVHNAWILDWVCHALTRAPLELYHPPLYYPGRYVLAYGENLIGVALLVLPFHIAGASPIALHNIAMLLGFALSGYGMFVLARLIARSTAAALVAGVIFAFVPFKIDHLSHLQIVSSGWIPLLLAAVIHYWRAPSMKAAVLITAAFVMNGLTNVHYFLFGSLTAAITIVVLAIVDRRWPKRTLVAALFAGGLILVPFLLPYRMLAKEHGMKRSEGEALSGSAPPAAWLVTTPRNIVYGDLGPPELHRHEMQLFPGLAAVLLAAVGAMVLRRDEQEIRAHPAGRSRRWLDVAIVMLAILTWLGIITDRIEWTLFGHRIVSFDSADVPAMLLLIAIVARLALRGVRTRVPAEGWAAAAWIAIGVVGSFGMHAFFHAFLYRRVGIFQAIRAPVRWAVIAYIGLAVFAALGALALLRRYRGDHRILVAGALVAIAAADLWPAIRWERAVTRVPPLYRWLKRERPAPFIELPMAGGQEFAYLFGSMHHHLPQFNGLTPFSAPLHARLREKSDKLEYDAELLALLERNGCRLVVVHAHALGDAAAPLRAWLARHLADGRLAYVRSFDHEIGGDFAFAVTRNLPDWQRLAEPNAPDGAGHLPAQKLARMLAGQTTHSNAIIARVESPQPGELVRGGLRVRGWTLSPFTITRVTLLLEGGRLRINVPLVDPRPDVKQQYHWYYFTPLPGFDTVLPRPKNLPRATNLQIEIEDEGGRVMRTADILFDWEDLE